MANNPFDGANNEIEKARRELERLLGMVPGSSNPAKKFFEDAERVNRALGDGFKLMQDLFPFQDLKDRIEALHYDMAAHVPNLATLISRQALAPKPRVNLPPSDHYGRRY